MSNQQNDQFYELAQDWLEEDLYRIIKKTRQHPGLEIKRTAITIGNAFGDDLPFLLKELKKIKLNKDIF